MDDPLPENWQDLQTGVQRIFRNVGLFAEVEVDLETPRGSVNVDVLATDVRSVDKIRYIVECKNWGSSIPQTVVHSFTTVMHETGANIGFIISKHGLQQGAKQYTQNTNIIGMTYLEFQKGILRLGGIDTFVHVSVMLQTNRFSTSNQSTLNEIANTPS